MRKIAIDRQSPRRFGPYLILGLAAGAVALGMLYVFPPEQYGFYPQCLFNSLTGWQCPGCGGLRAMHHILHGHVAEALRLNPFLPVAGVWALTLGIVEISRWRTARPNPNPLRCRTMLWAMGVLMVLFGIARNL